MSIKTEVLFNNTWNVRISDPGEEGAQSHFFETIYLTLTAYFEGENVRYEFVRKVEDQVKIKRSFTELSELFKFLGDYLDPVSLGNLGVKMNRTFYLSTYYIIAQVTHLARNRGIEQLHLVMPCHLHQ